MTRGPVLAGLALTAAALATLGYGLGQKPPYIFYEIAKPAWEAARITRGISGPPSSDDPYFYAYPLRALCLVATHAVMGLRPEAALWPGVLAGCAVVCAAVGWGWVMRTPWMGLLAGALTLWNRWFVGYARMGWANFLFETAGSILFMASVVRVRPALTAAACALLVFNGPRYSGFLLLWLPAWLALERPGWPAVRRLAGAAIMGSVIGLAGTMLFSLATRGNLLSVSRYMLAEQTGRVETVTHRPRPIYALPARVAEVAVEAFTDLTVRSRGFFDRIFYLDQDAIRELPQGPGLVTLPVILAILAGLVRLARRRDGSDRALLLWGLSVLTFQTPFDDFELRRLLPILPALGLMAAEGVRWLGGGRKIRVVVLAAGVLVIAAGDSVLSYWRRYDQVDPAANLMYRGMREAAAAISQDRDALIVFGRRAWEGEFHVMSGFRHADRTLDIETHPGARSLSRSGWARLMDERGVRRAYFIVNDVIGALDARPIRRMFPDAREIAPGLPVAVLAWTAPNR